MSAAVPPVLKFALRRMRTIDRQAEQNRPSDPVRRSPPPILHPAEFCSSTWHGLRRGVDRHCNFLDKFRNCMEPVSHHLCRLPLGRRDELAADDQQPIIAAGGVLFDDEAVLEPSSIAAT